MMARDNGAARTASVPRAIPMPSAPPSAHPVPAGEVRPELALELHSLRQELQEERTRSRALSERMRDQLRALDMEILHELPRRRASAETTGCVQTFQPEEVSGGAKPSDMQAACATTGTPVSGGSAQLTSCTSDVTNSCGNTNVHGDQVEDAVDATALARALHESVRDLIEQGMEFRTLAVRRESELKAALEASERARVQAEGKALSRSSSHSLKIATNAAPDQDAVVARTGLDQAAYEDAAGLQITNTEQAVCEALVSRLEAQVRTLEMQVDCLGGELASVQLEAAEWKKRHHMVEADNEVLRKEYHTLEDLLTQGMRRAADAPTPTRAPARLLVNRPSATISYPDLDSAGQSAGLGCSKKGGSCPPSPLLGLDHRGLGTGSQSQLVHQPNTMHQATASCLGGQTPTSAGSPVVVSRPGGQTCFMGGSGSLAAWAIAKSRSALSAEPPGKVVPRTSAITDAGAQTPTLS